MCGRFALTTPASTLAAVFELEVLPELVPRTNIAPGQTLFAVVRGPSGRNEGTGLRWGLIPSWAKDPGIARKLINARSETAATKPSFRAAFRRRRCLVLADGFYEWTRRSRSEKIPHLIQLDGGQPFAMAALWERWFAPDGDEQRTVALLTTGPNDLMQPIHHRMPVILPAHHTERWLDPDSSPEALQELLRPYDGPMRERVVSKRVNNARNEGPEVQGPPEEDDA